MIAAVVDEKKTPEKVARRPMLGVTRTKVLIGLVKYSSYAPSKSRIEHRANEGSHAEGLKISLEHACRLYELWLTVGRSEYSDPKRVPCMSDVALAGGSGRSPSRSRGRRSEIKVCEKTMEGEE